MSDQLTTPDLIRCTLMLNGMAERPEPRPTTNHAADPEAQDPPLRTRLHKTRPDHLPAEVMEAMGALQSLGISPRDSRELLMELHEPGMDAGVLAGLAMKSRGTAAGGRFARRTNGDWIP